MPMDYVFKTPSTLQHVVSVKIVAELWNHLDIRSEFEQFDSADGGDDEDEEVSKNWCKWDKLLKKVFEKVSAIPSPEPLKDALRSVIEAIGLEVLKWWYYHKVTNSDLVLGLPKELCWTTQGTVDREKTAQVLVKDEGLDVERRFKLACVYCLEDEIYALWKLLPRKRKVKVYAEMEKAAVNRFTSDFEDPYKSDARDLVYFWTCTVRGGEETQLNNLIQRRNMQSSSINQLAFQCSAYGSNVVACEYYLKRLSHVEKDLNLVDCALHSLNYCNFGLSFACNIYNDVIVFLLNQMSEEQMERVFVNKLFDVLRCLSDYPWQGFFVKTVKRWWQYVSARDYSRWLTIIVGNMCKSNRDYNYSLLFLELWRLGPVDYKSNFIEHQGACSPLDLFEVEEEELVRVVLKEATADQLKLLIECPMLVDRGEWEYLEFLLNEGFVSKRAVTDCKRIVLERFHNGDLSKYQTFFSLADSFFSSKQKQEKELDSMIIMISRKSIT